MTIFLLMISGFVGGILGGMGLGGGTLLIPILTVLLKIPHRMAAWVNLVVFLPMAAVSLIVHVKNKMVDRSSFVYLLSFAMVGEIPALFFAGKSSERGLRVGFGCFLILLGALSLISVLIGFFKKKPEKKK